MAIALQWLRKLMKKILVPEARRRELRRYGLHLEEIEERVVPTAWVVGDNSDSLADPNSLRYILSQVANGDSISFASTVTNITLSNTGNTSGLVIDANVSLNGGGTVTINGGGSTNFFTVFTVNSGVTATLSGLTIDGGDMTYGGGIDNQGILTVNNCFLTNNSSSAGGGIFNSESALLTLNNCTVASNSSMGLGGGIFGNGPLTLNNCTVNNNAASDGGGICSNIALTINNSTISNNTTTSQGGGINIYGTLTLNNSTIAYNSTAMNGGGGGIFNLGYGATLNGDIVVANTFGSSTPDDIDGDSLVSTSSDNLVGIDNTGSLTNGKNGNQVGVTVAEAGLTRLGYYGGPDETIALMPGSYAIGNGTVGGGMGDTTDERGFTRDSGVQDDAGAFQTAPLTVNTNYDSSGAVGIGYLTLRNALNIANANTTSTAEPITFSSTAFATTQTIALTSTLTLSEAPAAMSITGPSAGIVISGNNESQILEVNSGVTATLAGLAIESGLASDGGGIDNNGTLTISTSNFAYNTATDYGGAIYNSSSGTLTLNNNIFNENKASYGGGIYNLGTLTIGYTNFSNNSATYGGGIYNSSTPAVSINNSTLNNNTATDSGGAIYNNNGTLTLSYSSFANNTATNDSGGGIFNNATLTLNNSTIADNSANGQYGGGIANDNGASGSLTVNNSTIVDNSAVFGGGLLTFATMTVSDSTIADNNATTGAGGGIYNEGYTTINGDIVVANTLGGSTRDDIDGLTMVSTSSDNLVGVNSPGGLSSGNGNQVGVTVAQADLSPLAENGGPTETCALLLGSFALGKGLTSTVATDDQRGVARPIGQPGDVGAFQFSNPPAISANPSSLTVNVNQNTSFSATATDIYTDGTTSVPTTVQWQISTNGGQTYTPLSSGGVYGNSVTSDTLTITGVTAAMNGDDYEAIFTNPVGQTATTSMANLTVDYVTANPSNATANVGQTATFTAASSNPDDSDTVQWQVNENDGNGFTNINGATSTTLTISKVTPAENGYQYQAVFSNTAYGGSLTTNPATLSVDYVTANPNNLTVNAGQTATFTAATSNPDGTDTVQWQVDENNGNGFTNINGATSTTLTISNVTVAEIGYEYQAVFSNAAYSGTLTTNPATLNVDYVTANPSTVTLNVGQTATFTAASFNPDDTDIVQWQVNENNGNGFTDIPGANGDTLTLKNVTAAENDYFYQAVFSNSAYSGTLTTSPATLMVDYVTSNPSDVAVVVGQTASFTAATSNPLGTDTVQWQVNENNGDGFTNISGATNATLTISNVTTAEDGYDYQAVFSNSAYGGTLTTSPAQLTDEYAPAFTSSTGTTFTVGAVGSFPVMASGYPDPNFAAYGTLPSGVALSSDGLLSGKPAAGTGGTYPIVIVATNGISPDAIQGFTLSVDQAPAITSSSSTTFTVGASGSFSTTASGYPASTFTESGPLPSGVTLSLVGVLSGTPVAGTGGTYPITITATNGISPDATQSFTLTVDQAPAISSVNNTTFTVGTTGSFSATASGYPSPTFTEIGTLPTGVTLSSAGVLSGKPAVGASGTYSIVIEASNGVSPEASQAFTLTVDEAPAITSSTSTGFSVGSSGSFQVTASGYPAPTFTETGPLPSGVTLTAAGLLSGTPLPGTAGTYPIVIEANNGISAEATQPFILMIGQAPSLANSFITVQPSVESGNSCTITLQAVDLYGNDLTVGGLHVAFALGSTSGGQGIISPTTDQGNGTYTATFTGTIAGSNTITATIGGQAVISTAPSISVTPGSIDLSHSQLSTLLPSVQLGGETTIVLQGEDAYGNKETTGGVANIAFKLENSTGGQGTISSVTDNGNGTYTATFIGTVDGSNTIEAAIGGSQVTSTAAIGVTGATDNLAYSIITVPAPGSVQSGSGIMVTLQADYGKNEKESSGGLNVAFGLASGSGGQGTFGPVSYIGNGEYAATFMGTIVGSNAITATIDGSKVISKAAPIKVTAGQLSYANSLVTVSAPSVKAGSKITVTFHPRDAAGNILVNQKGLPVSFALSANSTAQGTFTSAIYNKITGTYTATFTGTIVGGSTIVTTVNGQPITFTPPVISVIPGTASAAKSTLAVLGGITQVVSGSGITLRLQAVDGNGNLETAGGLIVGFKLASAKGGLGTFSKVIDNKNGTYTVTFTGTIAGTNTIEATIGGVKVTATAAVTVTPGFYSLVKSLVTLSKPVSVAPGKTITVFLQTKDAAGNNLTTDLLTSGGTIEFEPGNVNGGGQGTFASATYIGNGEYEATFTADSEGSNTVVALIDNSPVTSKVPAIKVT